MKAGFAVVFLYAALAIRWLMIGETFWGLLSVALAIIFVWFELRHRIGGIMSEMRRSQVDEKIAALYGHASNIKTWTAQGIDISHMGDRIAGDIRAVVRVEKVRTTDQKERLNAVVRHIIEELKKNHFETEVGKIEDVAKLLN